CTVTGNEIHDNGAGVMIEGGYRLPWSTSYGNVITRNNISGSSHLGLYLEDSRENQITENNFINQDNMYFHFFIKMDDPNPSKPLYNDINRNYWSDWSSSEPKPIEGEVEIAIWLFILDFPWYMYDENPADEPYDW
ncbi:MAG: right-handed parallel beta-helix repeat-containing protein, partial [Thermoplasmatota archaeon]